MEFLRVNFKNPPKLKKKIAVLINGEKNGYVGQIIQLDPGFVEVSVNLLKAPRIEIELKNTTATKPMEVLL